VEEAMREAAAAVTVALDKLLLPVGGMRGRVVEAMRYSALSGGKRLRPFLVLTGARVFDVAEDSALRTAAAVEMVHCYSLIHDDLPAMDDSNLRRGLPTVHRRFDVATAILAGDGLLTEAFGILADPATHSDAAVRAELVAALSAAGGTAGMVGGQIIDISAERDQLDLGGITRLQRLKTGALIAASSEMGAILGRASPAARVALRRYGQDLGFAFQIADDLLDAEGSPEEIGKPTGQDAAAGKATFVSLLGAQAARKEAESLTERACTSLDLFGEKADLLKSLARFVINRRS
jgi:farnesyl diphosphate synthase